MKSFRCELRAVELGWERENIETNVKKKIKLKFFSLRANAELLKSPNSNSLHVERVGRKR